MRRTNDGQPTWRRGLTLFAEVGGVVAFVILIITAVIATNVRDWIATAAEDVATWLYPDRLIALLVLAFVGVLLRHVLSRRRPAKRTPTQRKRDRDLLKVLVETTPRTDVKRLAGHDFGTAWRDDQMLPLQYMVEERDEVEHRFYEPVLEKRRRELIAAINDLLDAQAERAGVDPRGRVSISAWDETPHPEGDAARERRKAESRKVLNDKRDRVVATYNSVIERSRELGILERTSWQDQ